MAIIKIKDNANNRMLWINTDFINSIEQYENESVTIFSNKYIQSFDEKDGKLFLRYYEEFLRETNSESLREVLQITEAK